MAISEHTVREVAAWLDTEGYRIELQTALAFQNAEPSVGIAVGAFIGDSTPRREVDLCVSHHPCTRGRIMIVCECKYLKRPWILLRGPGGQTNSMFSFLLAAKTRTLIEMAARREVLDSLEANFHFRSDAPAAYGVIEALKNARDADRAYATMMKVTDVTFGYASSFDRINASGGDTCVLFLPLVVVEGQLFEASYDSTAKGFVVKEARWGRVSWSGGDRRLLVDVVRLDYIREYAEQAVESLVQLGSLVRQYLGGDAAT